MDLSERLHNFEEYCSNLFSQVDGRISSLDFAIDSIRERVLDVQEQMIKLTSDRNKATRLCSPSSYPSIAGIELKIEPIFFSNYNLIKSELSNQAKAAQDTSDNQLDSHTKQSLDQVNKITLPIARRKPVSTILNPFVGIRSVSSLLVYHTYENRLIQTDVSSRKLKSRTSDSSLHDYASRSNRFKTTSSLFHDKDAVNKSSSGGGESEQNLGPVPESILKYHQESLIEPDTLESINILNYQGEDADPLTRDLPDTLPSLPGIVKVVRPMSLDSFSDFESQRAVAANQITPTRNNGFLDQFKHLFYPIESLPLPESYSSQQEN